MLRVFESNGILSAFTPFPQNIDFILRKAVLGPLKINRMNY